MKTRFSSLLSWLIALLVPVALLGLALRLILTPVFLQVEYLMPAFPPDEYGFTLQDRLHWSNLAWNYVVNRADISYLGDLKFPDGSPLYNDRELSHMQDVKGVVRGAFTAWYLSLAVLVLLGIWAWHGKWLSVYLRGLRLGGWLVIGLGGLIGLIVVAGLVLNPDVFWEFFAFFHSLFFKGNTWLFLYSDTLIRLFPLRFWEDTFLIGALITLGGGLGLALGLKRASRPVHDV